MAISDSPDLERDQQGAPPASMLVSRFDFEPAWAVRAFTTGARQYAAGNPVSQEQLFDALSVFFERQRALLVSYSFFAEQDSCDPDTAREAIAAIIDLNREAESFMDRWHETSRKAVQP